MADLIPMVDEKKPGSFIGQAARLSSIGIELVVSTAVGLAIGWYLDERFDTSPWLTIIFLVFGIVAGYRNIFREIKKIDRS